MVGMAPGTNGGGSNHPTSTAGQNFGDLQVTGLAAQRPTRIGNGAMSRPISAASQTALTADDSTAWFSVLMTATGGDGFAANSFGTLILGDAPLDRRLRNFCRSHFSGRQCHRCQLRGRRGT